MKAQDVLSSDLSSSIMDGHEFAKIAKALGHEARIQIVNHLADTNKCVCGRIVEVLPLAQSTVSQHLKVLKQAGVIHGEVEGPSICYCLNWETINRFKAAVAALKPRGEAV